MRGINTGLGESWDRRIHAIYTLLILSYLIFWHITLWKSQPALIQNIYENKRYAPPHNLEFWYFNNERIKRSLFRLGRADSTRERRSCSMSRHEEAQSAFLGRSCMSVTAMKRLAWGREHQTQVWLTEMIGKWFELRSPG